MSVASQDCTPSWEENRVLKFAIKIISPIRLERIRNGEKVIVQSGPTAYEVEVSEDGPEKFKSQGSQTARAKKPL